LKRQEMALKSIEHFFLRKKKSSKRTKILLSMSKLMKRIFFDSACIFCNTEERNYGTQSIC